MLVLSRKKGEQIISEPPGNVGQIIIEVVEIRGDKVRLGIAAPRPWSVHRMETWEAIHGKLESPPKP